MQVDQLLQLVPADLLEGLAIDTKVDRYAKKLQGEVLFKLLLHCLLTHKENSLRSMQSAYEALSFQLLNGRYLRSGIAYSSISERLSHIEVAYFERLYRGCVKSYEQLLAGQSQSISFDSTIVSLSAALLQVGYQLKGDSSGLRQLKFTIGYSEIPCEVCLFYERPYISENTALREVILRCQHRYATQVKVFDQGITARRTYEQFSEQHIYFVSRLSPTALYEPCSANRLAHPIGTKTLEIYSDQQVSLFASQGRSTAHVFRLVKARSLRSGKELWFITNLASDLSAQQITELYKKRWDIEVFFKFLKQQLNFNHLINRSENGIQVLLYVTLIAAILLAAYKKTNAIRGFKIAKQKLAQQLEFCLVKDLIQLCGGKPELIYNYVHTNSS